MIVSVTHEHDLDGLGSQAIIYRYFKQIDKNYEIKLIYAHYLNFVEIIRNVLDSEVLPEKLIISDIGFNEEFKELFPLFERIIEHGCEIFWFDHHLVEEDIKENLESSISLYLNNPDKCAAEVIKDFYLPEDSIAIRIAEFARDTDFRTEKFKSASDLQLIIGFNKGANKYREKVIIVELLAKGDFQNTWFDEQLKNLQYWYSTESKNALEHLRFLNIENFGEIIISYANMGGGKITLLLSEKFPKRKAYIGIDKRFNEIIIHSEYINCRDFAKEFEGGGHRIRAGFKYPNIFIEENVLNQTFINDLKINLVKHIK
ncbi:MAG: DHH family phosphoesterase [Candidatus Hodarchaeota archaeon]